MADEFEKFPNESPMVTAYRDWRNQHDDPTQDIVDGWCAGWNAAIAYQQQPQGDTCKAEPKHPKWALTERKVVGTWETLTNNQIYDGWSYEGGQGEPQCILCAKDAEIASLRFQNNSIQDFANKKVDELAALVARRHSDQRVIADLQKMVDEKQERITQQDGTLSSRHEQILEYKERIRELEQDLQDAKESVVKFANAEDELKLKIAALEAQVRAAEEVLCCVKVRWSYDRGEPCPTPPFPVEAVIPISKWHRYEAAKSTQPKQPALDDNQCAVCGWPLAPKDDIPYLGCVRGDCSMRPRPDKLYDPKRAKMAARVADVHWPESGHVHQGDAVSCQMSISIEIRRLKSGVKDRLSASTKEVDGQIALDNPGIVK